MASHVLNRIERMLHPEIGEKVQLPKEVAREFPFRVVRYH